MIELRYNPQLQDFIEFNLFHSWNSPEKKKDRFSFILKHLLWSLIPVIIYCFFIFTPVKDDVSIPLFIGFMISGIYMLYMLLTVKTSIRSNALKFYSNPENRSFFEETFLIISDTVIISKQTSRTAEYQLASILKISENKGTYYFYTNSMQAVIVPKRAFDSKEKLEKFLLLIK
ncbi:MAG: YcxB family protein [Chitinophagaceae bacterium]|jgi:hypothetical protein|nr:YcxB family protein [Chitinophagaceae bacterium]